MANLNFITTNTVPTISDQIVRQRAADQQAEEQSMRTRYDHEERVRGAKALNEAINAVQARQAVQPQQVAQPQPVQEPVSTSDANDPMIQGAGSLSRTGQQVSPISQITAQPMQAPQRLTRQDLMGALGTDRATAPQRFALMQQEVAQGEQQDTLRRQEASKIADRVWDLAKGNDPANLAQARQLAKQNGMNIPEEFWTDKTMRARVAGMVSTFKDFGLRGDQIPAAMKNYQTAQGATEQERMMNAVADVPQGLAYNPYARQGAGGASGSNGVQRSFSSGGTMWALMKDGSTRQLTKPDGSPLKSNEVDKFRGQVYIKGLGNVMIDDPMAVANSAASALYPEQPSPPARDPAPKPPNRIRFDAQGNRIQ